MFSTEPTARAVGWVRSLYLSIHRKPREYTDRDLEQIMAEAEQLKLTAESELINRRAARKE